MQFIFYLRMGLHDVNKLRHLSAFYFDDCVYFDQFAYLGADRSVLMTFCTVFTVICGNLFPL